MNEQDQPDPSAIISMINRHDFDAARKAIGKISDADQKVDLFERLNCEEAIFLIMRGDVPQAIEFTSQLHKASSILKVYPLLVRKCVNDQDSICATNSVDQAVKTLRKADRTAPKPLLPLPADAIVSEREFDPVVQSLCSLALSISRIDINLSLNVLDEMVLAANKSSVDVELGRVPFSVEVFSRLGPLDDARVQQSAMALDSPLPKIFALAAITKSRARQLTDKLNEQSLPRKVATQKP